MIIFYFEQWWSYNWPFAGPSPKTAIVQSHIIATVTMWAGPTNISKMMKRAHRACAHGVCKSDTTYPERLSGGVVFFPFPKPKTQRERCLQWIKQCGRPQSQLNVSNITKHKYVCWLWCRWLTLLKVFFVLFFWSEKLLSVTQKT